jgi:hypothetical protein
MREKNNQNGTSVGKHEPISRGKEKDEEWALAGEKNTH